MNQLKIPNNQLSNLTEHTAFVLILPQKPLLTLDDQLEIVDRDNQLAIGRVVVEGVNVCRLGQADTSQPSLSLIEHNTSSETPVQIVDYRYEPYVQGMKVAENDVEKSAVFPEVKVFADGGSRGNPGPSASGYALLDMHDKILVKEGFYLGITTNNQAEYQALKLGLKLAHKYGARKVHVYMDSLLVVNQMKGIFKVKNRDLWPIHQDIKELAGQFSFIEYTHVPREFNKIADGMVNEILDGELKS